MDTIAACADSRGLAMYVCSGHWCTLIHAMEKLLKDHQADTGQPIRILISDRLLGTLRDKIRAIF